MLRPRAPAAIAVLLFAFLLAGAHHARSESPQPIGYSHKIHVTDYGIDCRFCHSAATKSAFAGIPSVEKCMVCHRSIAVNSPEVKKIAQHWREKTPIPWIKVIDRPDHVYFPHRKMVNAGVACLTCHPGMDKADAAVQRIDFGMGFCMDCHRKRKVSIDCWTCHW